MPRVTDTIAALATPAGTAAIAVVRISGPDTERLARELLGTAPPPRVVRHGDYRDRAGATVDDVLFTYFAAPHSYTGEDALEISGHGNPFIAHRILEDLLARGVRAAGPGEFTQRAFLNGKIDLSQAEAVMDLIHARSERALQAANRQLRGALGRRMEGLVDGLLGVVARVEAYIDFPEEDLPPEDRTFLMAELGRLLLETNRLTATSRYGELLRDGVKTVIVGEPNVGKSSLLNRLVGRDRALVSPEAGTTRDFIEERVVVGPHCLRLIDTAGLNPTATGLEKQGIAKTLECVAEADLVLRVYDATADSPALPQPEAPDLAAKPTATIAVLNKVDLLAPDDRRRAAGVAWAAGAIGVSALSGLGLDALEAEIVRRVDAFREQTDEELVAINARHAAALTEAKVCLTAARDKLCDGGVTELLASDLRGALAAYGEISGRIDHEQMLDRLFATFCIGK